MHIDTPRTLIEDRPAVVILDQTQLPHRRVTHRLATLEDAAHAIRAMQVRGAPLIGVTAAYGVALAMQSAADGAALNAAVNTLAATRPTAVNLQWALARMRARLAPLAAADRAEAAWAEAHAIAAEDATTNHAIGEHGLRLIVALASHHQPVQVLTHCNAGWLATTAHGTALAPVYAAQRAGIAVHVHVSETRPRNQGLLTAWELNEAGVPHTLIADNAAGLLLRRGEIDVVIVGADRIAANGDTANKIGTYLKALAAKDNNVPFYVAAPRSTIDMACANGEAIPIEDREADEVRQIAGLNASASLTTVALAPPSMAVANPAFDVTPAALISGIITERGVRQPAALREFFAERP